MSGTTKQAVITNGVVAQDIARAKQDLKASQAMGQALNRIGRAIDREQAKFATAELKAKFLDRLRAALDPHALAEPSRTD